MDRVVFGAVVGLGVGSLCGSVDTLFNRAIAWAVRHTPNRVIAGLAGAVIATAISGAMALLILGAVGWVGNCWG